MWETVKIDSFGKVVTGKTPSTKQPEYYGGDYPFITPTDMADDARIVSTERTLSDKGYAKQKNSMLPAGSICFVCIGATIGKICMTQSPSFSNQQINSIVPTERKHNKFFIYYLMRTQSERVKSVAGGAATPIVNKTMFSNLEVSVPKLEIQNKIASILSAYDDLIENNLKRIKILEEMAQMIYREWFVNFRFPGHEKVKMVSPSPSGRGGGEGVNNIGKIPEGWEVKKLVEFGEVLTGKTPSKKKPAYYNENYMPFIKTPDMHGSIFVLTTGEYLSKEGAKSQKKKTLPPDSICVSCIGTIGIVSITSRPSQTNQQINSIVLEQENYREFLYFSITDLKETMTQYGSTGATMANLSKGKFELLKILCPSNTLLDAYHDKAAPMFDSIKNLLERNMNLRKTRDLLLPRLISGELDVEGLDINTDFSKGH